MQTLLHDQVTQKQRLSASYCSYSYSPQSEDMSTSQDDNEQRCRITPFSQDIENPETTLKIDCNAKNLKEALKPRIDHTKEKSQLCRTFVEKGYCPYNQKCKFAHGSHQLRQNQEFNSRYKTKECGSFFKRGFCCYGNRCNFRHQRIDTPQVKLQRQTQTWNAIMKHNRKLILQCRQQSTLLRILGLSAEN